MKSGPSQVHTAIGNLPLENIRNAEAARKVIETIKNPEWEATLDSAMVYLNPALKSMRIRCIAIRRQRRIVQAQDDARVTGKPKVISTKHK